MSTHEIIDLVAWLIAIAAAIPVWRHIVKPCIAAFLWNCERCPQKCVCRKRLARRIFNSHQLRR